MIQIRGREISAMYYVFGFLICVAIVAGMLFVLRNLPAKDIFKDDN